MLVKFQHKLLKHAGVETLSSSLRDSYCTIELIRLAIRVKQGCVPCYRQDAQACNQVVAPLPEFRVSEAPPFTFVDIDFAGPLFCGDVPQCKFYICLFSCAVIHAVHLELTDFLSAVDFLLALNSL